MILQRCLLALCVAMRGMGGSSCNEWIGVHNAVRALHLLRRWLLLLR